MPAAAKKKLDGVSRGVRPNASQRRIIMARPICPHSQRKRGADGSFSEVGMNCQLAGGEWWVHCQEQGHDPYFSSTTYYEPVDITDDEGFVIGQKKRAIHVKRLNTASVFVSRRLNSGRGVLNKKAAGYKRLEEMGYEEVCQYRNCEKPVNKKYATPGFGDYCSFEHLTAIAASEQSILVPQINGVTEGTRIEQVRMKRNQMLRESVVNYLGGASEL